jgi:hypothetical protein
MGGGNVQRVDVEAAAGEHAGHARKDAELVFNKDRDGVSHEVKLKTK